MPINYRHEKYKGVITFPLNKGVYNVVLQYRYTPVSLLAQKISLFGVFGLLFYLLAMKTFSLQSSHHKKNSRSRKYKKDK